MCSYFIYLFNISLSLSENSGGLTRVGHSSPKSSAIHSYRRVLYERVSQQRHDCQCWGFLTCTQMLLHGIAHGGCTDTVRESALKADSGRKIPYRTWDSIPRQYYQLSYVTPRVVVLYVCRGRILSFVPLLLLFYTWAVRGAARLALLYQWKRLRYYSLLQKASTSRVASGWNIWTQIVTA